MPSPFPGFDPYLEATGKWEDFHNKLMGDIERDLSQSLPARYAVRMGERSYVEFVEPQSTRRGEWVFKPDVGIKSGETAQIATAAETSVLEKVAVDMECLVEIEFRELFIEIYELGAEQRLVTGIEILSPSNKRHGTVGWYQYERKRSMFILGHANLVEIDLLRGGQRMPMAGPWADSPYYVMVLRKERAPIGKVLAADYREPLPTIPIPLAPPDPDATLPLQRMIEIIYDRSRYAREIDYALPLRPPLPDADAAWIAERVKAWKSEGPR